MCIYTSDTFICAYAYISVNICKHTILLCFKTHSFDSIHFGACFFWHKLFCTRYLILVAFVYVILGLLLTAIHLAMNILATKYIIIGTMR